MCSSDLQTPPRYSAVKVAGRPLYDYARKGVDVEVKARPIRIDAMELLSLGENTLRVAIHCGRGTYARVLAEEIGVALGTFGHLAELRRLGSGPFDIDRSVSFSRLAEIVAGNQEWDRVLRPARGGERIAWRPREEVFAGLAPWLIAPREALRHLPALTLSPIEVRRFQTSGALPPPPPGCTGSYVLLSADGVLGVGVTGKDSAIPLDAPRPRDRRSEGRGR